MKWSLGALLLVGCATQSPAPPVLDESYFPMAVGHRWVYASDEGEVTFTVTGRERSNGTSVFVVRRTIADEEITFHVSVARDGVRIHRAGTDVYTPPFQEFVFPSPPDHRWEWEGRAGEKRLRFSSNNLGLSDIRVPLGTYRAFVIQEADSRAPGTETHFWLARGIGVVRLTGKILDEHRRERDGILEWEFKARYYDWKLKGFFPGQGRSDG